MRVLLIVLDCLQLVLDLFKVELEEVGALVVEMQNVNVV